MLLENDQRENNILRLLAMFKKIVDIHNGKIDYEVANSQFLEEMNNKYIYSKFGGKDNFEKTMMKQAKQAKQEKQAKQANKSKK